MRLSDLDLASMDDRSSPDRWGADDPQLDRRVYFHGDLWYKVWPPEYTLSQCYISCGDEIPVGLNGTLLGFHVGYFNQSISSAFVDFIHDENDFLRGYVTRNGRLVENIPVDFSRQTALRAIATGWVMADVRASNVIELNGALSLIDFDSQFTLLETFDLPHERKKGSISALIDPYFAGFIEGHVMSMRQQLTVADANAIGLRQPAATVPRTEPPTTSTVDDNGKAFQLPPPPGTA
jgi:hypothetical protein